MKKIILTFLFIISFLNANELFPKLDKKIIDEANLLSPKVKDEINSILTEHEGRRNNQIQVVILQSLNGYDIENYSNLLIKQINKKEYKENRVLLVISMAEKKINIEVGNGVSHALTHKISNEIINYTLMPNLKAKQYELAILKSINEIILALQGEYISKTDTLEFSKDTKFNFLITLGYFVVLFLLMYVNFSFISTALINSTYFGFLTFLISKEFTKDYLVVSATIFFFVFIINYIITKKFSQKKDTQKGANGGW
jgi:uncharacterized protein